MLKIYIRQLLCIWLLGWAKNDIVAYLLEARVNMEARDYKGSTPLNIAASTNNIGALNYLLLAGASTELRDRHGCAPFHNAIRYSNLDIVRLLLSAGVDKEATVGPILTGFASGDSYKGMRPLQMASSLGNIAMVRKLLAEGANVEARYEKVTSLHIACSHNNLPLVHQLLAFGAKYNVRNKDGCLPLELTDSLDIKKVLSCNDPYSDPNVLEIRRSFLGGLGGGNVARYVDTRAAELGFVCPLENASKRRKIS